MSESMIVICPSCRAKNKVSLEKAGQYQPVCGKCKASISPAAPGYPIEASDATFDESVVRSGVPTLVDFYSHHCGPCKAMEPVVERLAYDLAGVARVVKVNTDRNSYAPSKYQVRGVPTFVLFRGLEAGRMVGAQSYEALRALVERFVTRV